MVFIVSDVTSHLCQFPSQSVGLHGWCLSKIWKEEYTRAGNSWWMQEAVKPPTGWSVTVQQADGLVQLPLLKHKKAVWSCRCFPWLLMRENPNCLAGFPHRMNAQCCWWVVFFFTFFFFSLFSPGLNILICHIPLPGKILVSTVNAYLGKGPRSRADWRESSWMLNPGWVSDEGFACEVGAAVGQSLLCLSIYADWSKTSRRSGGTPR